MVELSERILFDEMPDAFDSPTDLTSAGIGRPLSTT